MQRRHAFPPELARYVESRWPEGRTLPVSSKVLADVLSIAFQASMTFEEGRATRFRLLLSPWSALPEDGIRNEGVLRLRFDQSRPFHEDELRRLAPSTPFESALIGTFVEEERLRIWGVAHSGPAWLAPAWGGRSVVPNWTFDPIIHVSGPGRLAVRCAGLLVGGLERGLIMDAVLDVFDSRWLPALFESAREGFRAEHAATQSGAASPTYVEPQLIGRIGQHMIRRVIQLVRGASHGGLILVVDADPKLSGVTDGLRIKYRFDQDEPPHRYRTLLLQLLAAISGPSSKPSVGWSDFALDETPKLERLERSVFELSRLIANLTSVDGAVVLDKRFGVVGYGAEVSAELPTPTRIYRALDTEGTERELYDIENVGTRHRAAYRFVNDHRQGLAIVVSHDGGVSFVAHRDGEVMFWEQSVSP